MQQRSEPALEVPRLGVFPELEELECRELGDAVGPERRAQPQDADGPRRRAQRLDGEIELITVELERVQLR